MTANERRVVVTGASSGIGAAAAEAFAAAGAHVWLTYANSRTAVEEVADRCRARGAPDVRTARLDLRSPESIDALVASIEDDWGHLHVLVNNGGTCPYTPMEEIDVDEWDLVMETNARGTFLLSRAALGLLRAAGTDVDRCIVNVSSIAGQVGALQTGMHYAASKAAILAVTRSFARQLAGEGIRVNAVSPGPIATAITQQLSPERFEAQRVGVPLGRYGTAEEAAWVVTSVAAPGARFVTGATWDVNGGVRID